MSDNEVPQSLWFSQCMQQTTRNSALVSREGSSEMDGVVREGFLEEEELGQGRIHRGSRNGGHSRLGTMHLAWGLLVQRGASLSWWTEELWGN